FASALAAAYFCFPPKFSFFISDPLNVAELGFFLLLTVIASKALAVVTRDERVTRRPLATAYRTNRTLRCTGDRPQFLQVLLVTAASLQAGTGCAMECPIARCGRRQ